MCILQTYFLPPATIPVTRPWAETLLAMASMPENMYKLVGNIVIYIFQRWTVLTLLLDLGAATNVQNEQLPVNEV